MFVLLSAALRIPTSGSTSSTPTRRTSRSEAQILESGGHLEDATRSTGKPPIVPYIYAATFELSGTDDLAAVRVRAGARCSHRRRSCSWSRRDGVWEEAQWRRRRRALPPAATAFRPQDVQAANFEVFMLPLMTAAMVLGIRRRPGAAGVTLAVATLGEQTAATTLLPLVWVRRGVWRRTWEVRCS